MPRESDEETWRAIVENFGDRAEIDAEFEDEPLEPSLPFIVDAPTPEPVAVEEETFVPPTPPPLPIVPRDRLIAWAGLFGSPTILLITMVLRISLQPWIAYLLIAGFVGGFIYLVVRMPRGPADPWDDGARL